MSIQAIVSEYCARGSVWNALHGSESARAEFSMGRRLAVAQQVAGAMAYLHAAKLLHRDLKASALAFVDGVSVFPCSSLCCFLFSLLLIRVLFRLRIVLFVHLLCLARRVCYSPSLRCSQLFSFQLIGAQSPNVLLTAGFEARVADFGLSRTFAASTMTGLGTVAWSAPETLAAAREGDAAADTCAVYHSVFRLLF
jgi:serine/threonine protein kinase